MFVTPGIVVDGKLVTTNLVDINLGIRILLGSSYYDDWQEAARPSSRTDPLGNPVDKRHPWNQTTIAAAAEARLQRQVHLGHVAALVRQAHRRSPRARHRRRTASRGSGPPRSPDCVDIGYVKATGHSVKINLPKTALCPRSSFEWKIPKWSNAIERDRARTYFQAYAAAAALYFFEQAIEEVHAGQHQDLDSDFKVPDEAIGCGFHEAVRGVLSHHVVIRDGKIANYHPYPPTPWNASPRDTYGTPGPYEDAVQNTPHLRGERPATTSRASTSCAPCAASIPACRAAFTCTSATAKSWRRAIRPCSA